MTIKNVIDCLRNLVQTPSLSGKEKDLALFIKEVLDDFSLDKVYIDKLGNVIGFIKGKAPHPLVVLEGHMDHVSTGNLTRWRYPPYAAKVVDGKIFGRGTVDMKAAIAAMIFAARKISGREHEGTLALCFVVHEETVEGIAIGQIIDKEFKKTPDLFVLGEATNMRLGIGHRGRAVIKVELNGKTAHASMPELGLNALHAASKLVNHIDETLNFQLPAHEKLGKATITAISLEASPQGTPQIPDKAEVLFDRRIVLGETEKEILKPIKTKLDELLARNAILDGKVYILEDYLKCWSGTKIKAKNFFPAWLFQDTAVINKALKVLSDFGLPARTHIWRFSTDGVLTYGQKQLPTIGFGPGEETLAHQPNECVSVKDLEKAVDVYAALAESFIF